MKNIFAYKSFFWRDGERVRQGGGGEGGWLRIKIFLGKIFFLASKESVIGDWFFQTSVKDILVDFLGGKLKKAFN